MRLFLARLLGDRQHLGLNSVLGDIYSHFRVLLSVTASFLSISRLLDTTALLFLHPFIEMNE